MEKVKEYLKKNKVLLLIIGISIFIIAIICLLLFNGKETYATEDENFLSLVCDDTVIPGGEFSCNISLTNNTFTAEAFQAEFDVADELTFGGMTFDESTDWFKNPNNLDSISIMHSASKSALILTNPNGVGPGTYNIGVFKYTVPEDAVANAIYDIRTQEIIAFDSNDTKYEFSDVSESVRVLSNIDTLSSITLSGANLNTDFSSDKLEYNATLTDSESGTVTITATATDAHASVEGDGAISLHYGTNIIPITVTSEAGTKKKYTVSIFKPYTFNTDKYIYNADNNYLYTGSEINPSTIISTLNLDKDLNGKIEDNKLIISYNEEKLAEINVINYYLNGYSSSNKVIYVGNDVSYSEFMNNISLNGVTALVKDTDGNTVTSGDIEIDYKFNVYYNNTLLEESTFDLEYLNVSDEIIIDKTNNIIKRIVCGTTIEQLLNYFDTSGSISVVDKDGNKVSNGSKVKTGDIINIKMGNSTIKYTASVLGDISGDGEINLGDVSILYNYLKGKKELGIYQQAAGDIIDNGIIKINDVARLYRYFKGRINVLEVE